MAGEMNKGCQGSAIHAIGASGEERACARRSPARYDLRCHAKTISVVVALSSQPRVGSAVTEETSLIEICRPRVLGLFTSIFNASQVCWLIFWCGAGL